MTERTLNQRTLDQLLPTLAPRLTPEQERAVRAVADHLDQDGLYISGHGREAEVFQLTFRDEDRQLRYSLPELEARAALLDEQGHFDLAEDLDIQRNAS